MYLEHHFTMRAPERIACCPYLGSAISADCLTRPQYVERSYGDAGKSRLPGREDVILSLQELEEHTESCDYEQSIAIDSCEHER